MRLDQHLSRDHEKHDLHQALWRSPYQHDGELDADGEQQNIREKFLEALM